MGENGENMRGYDKTANISHPELDTVIDKILAYRPKPKQTEPKKRKPATKSVRRK